MTTLTSLLLAALLWVPVRTLTCYGDSGQPVDWYECAGAEPLPGLAWGSLHTWVNEAWSFLSFPPSITVHSSTSRFVVYKLPAESGPGDAAQSGLRYKYMDKDSGGWRDGAGPINSSAGAVGRSLLPLYRNTSQVKGLLGWTWDGTPGPGLGEKLHVAPSISPSSPSCSTTTSHLTPVGLRTFPVGDTRRVRPGLGLGKSSGFPMHFPQPLN